MHKNIGRMPGLRGAPNDKPTRGITGLVYRSIRGTTQLVGGSLDVALRGLTPVLPHIPASDQREAIVAALNGVLGDHLEASGNPLAIPMDLRHNGQPVPLSPTALAAAIPAPGSRLLIMLHGLCMNDRQWRRKGHDHGAALAAAGYTPLYLRYNSGRHISINGRAFADLMEALVAAWPVPVEQIVLLGHSMGGLVSRSAHHYAQSASQQWIRHLRKVIFLGTPHHGSPLERGGNWLDRKLGFSPYTFAFTRLGKIRSAGITDLRHGYVCDEDWAGRDRFERVQAPAHILSLPAGLPCYAVGATLAADADGIEHETVGDGLVLLSSALGQHAKAARNLNIPAARQWIAYGTNHMDLLSNPSVCAQLQRWLAES